MPTAIIDHRKETLLSMPQAAKAIGVHVATLYRWHLAGLHGIRLETIKIGNKRRTSREALDRFIERTTLAADTESAPAPARQETDKAKSRRLAAVERQLDKAGL